MDQQITLTYAVCFYTLLLNFGFSCTKTEKQIRLVLGTFLNDGDSQDLLQK